ncbi:MAG: TlpA disulfide reductase family protein [Jatrophihabitantaceae bacterium]
MKLRLFAMLAVLALVATGCTGKDAVDQSAGGQFRFVSATSLGTTYPIAQRKKAGDFTGTLLSGGSTATGGVAGGGGTITLSQDAGKVVVINFWATWCGPCTTETPQFDAVYRAYQAKGVAFIGIDTKNSPSSLAQSFVADNHISYPIVFDEQGETALRLGKIPALSLPFTVIVDKHQRVAVVYLNVLAPKDLESLLNKLLAEH